MNGKLFNDYIHHAKKIKELRQYHYKKCIFARSLLFVR